VALDGPNPVGVVALVDPKGLLLNEVALLEDAMDVGKAG
jgi:hypothetical protein